MERKFLLYLLYQSLILIRGRGSHTKDNLNVELSSFLHNVPLQLIDDPDGKGTYKKLFYYIPDGILGKWFQDVQSGFFKKYPEYKQSI